jgi:hypothetical protein
MRFLSSLIILLLARSGAGQNAAAAAGLCADPARAALDYWVGSWSTTTGRGVPGGTSVVERVAGGCALLERFSGAQGGLIGAGLHTLDAATGEWIQYWVDSRGVTLIMKGMMADGRITYDWTAPVNGVPRRQRYALEPLPDGSLVQTGYVTTDDGATWQQAWKLTYRKEETSTPNA